LGSNNDLHHTRDILLVKKLLGHKGINNILKCTQLIDFKNDEYDVATATTVEEAKKIVATGFDYVTEVTLESSESQSYMSLKRCIHQNGKVFTKNLKCMAMLSVLLTYVRC